MPTLLLVRHGRTTANTAGLLAGRTPGVGLDARGVREAAGLVERLDGVPLAAAVHSPLQRCRETLAPLLAARPELPSQADERVIECEYGEWSNRKLTELAEEPLMDTVRTHPSAAVFPGGESLRGMQSRAVEAVRDWDEWIGREHGPEALWLLCTHGDIIKSVVADALGMHLDLFQRIVPHPASVTAIQYTAKIPFLLRFGDTGDLRAFVPDPTTQRSAPEDGNPVVGGGA